MRQLSPAGQQAVGDLAQRHGFSFDATLAMLGAVINGNGSMAQFNHPEFSGAGQWMRGGMIMISDMFNGYLKGRIDNLCQDLAQLVAGQPDLIHSGSVQSQSQGGNDSYQNTQYQGAGQPAAANDGPQHTASGGPSLFLPAAEGTGPWWPGELGLPNSTGAQNHMRYAYFQQARRLALDVDGAVTVYDTLDHQIGGVAQQQSQGGSLTFSSQYGVVNLASLPVITPSAEIETAGALPAYNPASPSPPPVQPAQEPAPAAPRADDIFALIDKLAGLHARGILTDEEFTAKKQDLLSRL